MEPHPRTARTSIFHALEPAERDQLRPQLKSHETANFSGIFPFHVLPTPRITSVSLPRHLHLLSAPLNKLCRAGAGDVYIFILFGPAPFFSEPVYVYFFILSFSCDLARARLPGTFALFVRTMKGRN